MKLVVLTDDSIDKSRRLLAEHGLCFYIEDDGKKILFDTGCSDVFIKNANILGINLLDLDYIVLSHGHYDHTWGLFHYLFFYMASRAQGMEAKTPTIIAHPDTFLEKIEEGVGEIGSILSEEKLRKLFKIKTTKEPYQLTKNLTFLGEVPRLNDFEAKEPMEKVYKDAMWQDDFVMEDSAIIYSSNSEISIITGCSHSGICNIVEQAKLISENQVINSIIGGLHLINCPENKMEKTIKYLKGENVKNFYPSHCTDFEARGELSKELTVKSIGVGSVISI